MKKFLFAIATFFLMSGISFAQNIKVIEDELQEVLNQKSDGFLNVNIVLKSQPNSAKIQLEAEKIFTEKSARKEHVINELKEYTAETQAELMSYLQAEERNGKVSDISNLWIVNTISCKATRDVIYRLSMHPDIAILGANNEIQLAEYKEIEKSATTSQQTRGLGHHITGVNADDVWRQGYTGKNVVVAVLDSGTNIYHKDIKNHLWTGEKDGTEIHGWNFAVKSAEGDSDINDEFGHGTHCAGIVCGDGTSGTSSGIAPDALLMTVKVVGRAGTGSVDQMLRGVQFAIENDADILSMSLGFKDKDLSQSQKETIRLTFDNALTTGVIVCAAAGNDGTSIGTPYNVDYPAACPSPWSNPDQTLKGGLSSVICVGADDLIGQSSQGPSTWEDTDYNDYPYNEGKAMGLIRPDISAPGNFVMSLNYNKIDAYAIKSGTSQATPCVAGVIALMMEKNPSLTPAQICEIIETTASNKPEKKNNIVGAGRIDALAAINAVTAQNQKPYIILESFTPEIVAQGNTVTLNVTIKNVGKSSCSENITATLETNSPYLTITSSTATVSTLGVDESATLTYTLNIPNATPDNHEAFFAINMTDGKMSWNEEFSIKVASYPEIAFISASPSVVNAGEETDITVTMQNKGYGAMPINTNLNLVTTENVLEYVTLIDDEASIKPLDASETATATFKIQTHEETPSNKSLDFFIKITSDVANKTNVIYEFEDDLQSWTTFDGNNDQYNSLFFQSNEAFGHGKTPKHSHSGNGHIMSETTYYSSYESTTPLNNFLVSPKFIASSNSKITFWARAHHAAYYAEHFGVAVSTKGNSKSEDFTLLQEWDIEKSQGTDWHLYTVDLGAYAGKDIYVAIRHFFTQEQWTLLENGYYVDALNIDDIILHNVHADYSHNPSFDLDDPTYFKIIVDNVVDLPAPSSVTATALGHDKIKLSWDAVARAQSYNVYRDGMKIANVTSTSYTDENLSHNITYYYKVAAVYAGVEYTHSQLANATTEQKEYSATVRVSPRAINVDGETTVDLNLTITNDGSKEFKARAYYTLTCEDNTFITITNNGTDLINALAPKERATKTISVKVSENVPHAYVFKFNLNLLSIITDPSQQEYFTLDIPFNIAANNPLQAPKNVASKSIGASSVTLGWNAAPNATSYNVYRNGEFIANTSSTIYIDNNLEKETNYCYKVTSVTETETSDFSDEICITTLAEDKGILVQSYDMTKQDDVTILTTTIINKSDAATAVSTTATLTSEDPYVTIIDETATIGAFAIGETVTAEFPVIISESIPENHQFVFNVVVETIGEDYGTLEYSFETGFDDWTNYIWTARNYTWEYNSSKKCIVSHSYKGGNRTPDNLICSPVKIKASDKTQVIWDVASSDNSYYAEHYGVYLTDVNPVNSYGWETLPSPIYEKTLTSAYSNYNFTTEKADASSAAGKDVWVVFRHFGCKNQDMLLVDNIKITNVLVPSPVYYYNTIYATIEPSTNIYNGNGSWDIASNWSKGIVPTATDNVIINGNATIENGDIIINKLLISEGSLTIEDGANITITGEFINTDADAFIINDGAQVFQNNEGVVATFNMNIVNPQGWTPMNKDGWQFIASPMTNANVISFMPQSETGYDLFKYDGTKEGTEWVNYKVHTYDFEDTFQQGRAYLASYEAETTATFKGTLNNATSFEYEVSYNADKELANFHLLGNPFSFNIDWSEIAAEGLVDGYAVVNKQGGYDYLTTGTIKVGDGFFVKATGTNPSLSYNHNNEVEPATRGSEKANSINVIATSKAGKDNVVVNFAGKAEGFDKLQNFNDAIATVYVSENGKNYGIANVDENTTEVALNFDAKEMGNYTISLDVNGEFEIVTLVDRFTGVETNMLVEDEYSFIASGDDNANRFVIRLAQGSQLEAQSQFVYQNGEELILSIEGSVQIVDMLGRVVYSNEHSDAYNRINVSEFNNATYVVRVVNEEGVKVQKVVIY